MKLRSISVLLTAGLLGTAAIAHSVDEKPKAEHPAKKGWVSLFDGKTLNGWHAYNKTTKVENWVAKDGILTCVGSEHEATNGDIVTDKEYGNFELTWDWQIGKGSNSGVMYHVVEDAKYPYTFTTGPEYQLIDEVGWDGKLEDWQKAGCDYAMHLPNEKKKLKPVGQWNTSKIIFNKGHVEHWLNGAKILEFEAWSPEWTEKKTTGKWKDDPDYGMAKKGRIALQAHGGKIAFKNIKIMELAD
ncbi:DUF1080 domain-containing protein [Mucilaginibacter sp. UR6-1]|uniref:3-keto-disaccharide hydrolase n=1 Tax=Mucilaginibacter sp. UR6-1 TaxID=1435643 RepID=UPI001E5794E7|nr:DUF1080 domain-containing protein [Mucilaginibacter sp. UR6-1]MCC8408897.1 DUF1080 domain-containing protein [Mucilaginibacter sp. UR6-1]